MEFEEKSLAQHKTSGKYIRLDYRTYNMCVKKWVCSRSGGTINESTLKRWYRPVTLSRHKDFIKWLIRYRACDKALSWVMENSHKSLYELWRTCPDGTWLEFIIEILDLNIPWYKTEFSNLQFINDFDKYSEKLATFLRKEFSWNTVKEAFEASFAHRSPIA